MKSFCIVIFCTCTFGIYAQSKKEQIKILTKRVDSLNRVVGEERSSNQNKINELNSAITKLEGQIATLSSNVTKISKELQDSKDDILKKQKDIFENQILISKLQSELKIKSDSLEIVKKEQSSHSYQLTHTGSYKSVKIGTQTWMSENLNVSTFRNGDPIPQAKTDEEWKRAGENKQPAWCYYDNDPKNGESYGRLYNWYAVNDRRGLAPQGWHIPSYAVWTQLTTFLGGNKVAGAKMKSTSGWKDNGNGNNTSGFKGLPGGYRRSNGSFSDVGSGGAWWSSTEALPPDAWSHGLFYSVGNSIRSFFSKAGGFSVRCLRD
jgi:uncharacterized protein (TIGR02145 family)